MRQDNSRSFRKSERGAMTFQDKKLLLAVERGDVASVRRMLTDTKLNEGGVMDDRVDYGEDNNTAHLILEVDINCCDPLGRSPLLMAIDNENLEMLELLLEHNADTKDALLHAIHEEYVEAVELLLEHEETICKPGQPHSWEAIPCDKATFTPDITPLVLAAHRDNYEIIKILLDRGSTLPLPHDVKCGCYECMSSRNQDSLRHSRSRINAYRALASPSLVALSSSDPILTAFELSWELRRLAYIEHEFRKEYMELQNQCQNFATALLDHTRSSYELAVILNHETNDFSSSNTPFMSSTYNTDNEQDTIETQEAISCTVVGNKSDDPSSSSAKCDNILTLNGQRMHLNRLKLAIKYKQKKFVGHPNVQQLLASIWYDGLPGFRQKNSILQFLEVCKIGMMFPILGVSYIIYPWASFTQRLRKPFIKFILNSASYFHFLFLLILASQRFEVTIAEWFQNEKLKEWLSNDVMTKRGASPTVVEYFIMAWVLGLIWSEIKQLWDVGIDEYINDMWNVIDFVTNSFYITTFGLRAVAYYKVQQEIKHNLPSANLPREHWDTWEPMLISEVFFASANIFSNLKLVYIFSINPHLGPLQVSLGRMVVDILKFCSLIILVVFAFSCGANQLLWYYADLEKQRCYGTINVTSITSNGPFSSSSASNSIFNPAIDKDINHCLAWRRFSNLWETSQTLFWSLFGLIDLENFELTGIKEFTRFFGLTMFGTFSVINITVLLNLLIAMMNHSYQLISVSSEKADTEWKYARSKLWISYFEEGATVPPPFNIIPTPKTMLYFLRWIVRQFCNNKNTKKRKMDYAKTRRTREARHKDDQYQAIMQNLIKRYVTQKQRQAENAGVTEDDVNEIKNDISTFRFELIDILRQSGMKVGTHTSSSMTGGKKNRLKERRLMKGFELPTMSRMTSSVVTPTESLFTISEGKFCSLPPRKSSSNRSSMRCGMNDDIQRQQRQLAIKCTRFASEEHPESSSTTNGFQHNRMSERRKKQQRHKPVDEWNNSDVQIDKPRAANNKPTTDPITTASTATNEKPKTLNLLTLAKIKNRMAWMRKKTRRLDDVETCENPDKLDTNEQQTSKSVEKDQRIDGEAVGFEEEESATMGKSHEEATPMLVDMMNNNEMKTLKSEDLFPSNTTTRDEDTAEKGGDMNARQDCFTKGVSSFKKYNERRPTNNKIHRRTVLQKPNNASSEWL